MVLSWTLFARSISVSTLRTNHISWDNDSLVINLALSKKDQSGENQTPKHIFANPLMPHICPILALALQIFSTTFRAKGETNVFGAGNPYELFGKWLSDTLKKISNLGFEINDFGTHSFRKGAATYCSGFLGGPSIVAIFLRAGWSL